jgi:hypothetical protein
MKANAFCLSPPYPPSAQLGSPVPSPAGPGRFHGTTVLRLYLLLALLFTSSASARTIYVSKTGSDANAGTSTRPYKTVQKAIYEAVDGDVIAVNQGDYAAAFNPRKRIAVTSWSGLARIVGINNQAPQVNVGEERTISPYIEVWIQPYVWDDGQPALPGALVQTWSLVSSSIPAERVSLPYFRQGRCYARFAEAGTYVFRLTVFDGEKSASDDLSVVVVSGPLPPPPPPPPPPTGNTAPVVNAGPDQLITLNTAAALSGTAPDDGKPNPPGAVTVQWSKVSGPGTATFANPASRQTTARFSAVGSYVLRLTASDGALSASNTVTIQVVTAPSAPQVNAGADQTIALPARASLNGQAIDDGLPNPPGRLTVTWSKVSGPGTVNFANTQALITTAGFSLSGTYVLRLTATDGQNSRSDDLTVTVNPQPASNTAPVVNAGPDRTVVAPAAFTLQGSVSDDGLPNPPGRATVQWSKVSGPGQATFQSATSASTRVTMNEVGTYVLRLTASDGQYSRSDDVQIIYSDGGGNIATRFRGGITYMIGGRYALLPAPWWWRSGMAWCIGAPRPGRMAVTNCPGCPPDSTASGPVIRGITARCAASSRTATAKPCRRAATWS